MAILPSCRALFPTPPWLARSGRVAGRLVPLVWLALVIPACNSGPAAVSDTQGLPEAGPTIDITPADLPNEVDWPPTGTWQVETVATVSVQGPLGLILGPEGQLWASALVATGTQPGCELARPPGPVQTFEAWVWQQEPNGVWLAQTVTTLDGGFGLALGLASNGQPLLALMAGTPGEEFCGGSDLVIARHQSDGTWPLSTAQDTSAVAGVTCQGMQAVCNTGDVTGMWPSLGQDAQGRAVAAFRDVHFGYTKEDYDSSDLEVATELSTGWQTWTIDDSSGSGRRSRIATDVDHAVTYIAYLNDRTGEVRLATGTDTGWTIETVVAGPYLRDPPALVVNAAGQPAVVLHDQDQDVLNLFVRDADRTWSRLRVDDDGRTGWWPAAQRGPDGRIWIAYYRCSRLGADACQPSEDGLRVAVAGPDGAWWRTAPPADLESEDGMEPAFVFDDAGRPAILYLQRLFDPIDGQPRTQLRLAVWVPS